jgi:outer membrane protein W
MIRVARLSSLVTIAVMACGTAQAQEPGKIGITMAYPASVGVIWDASKAIAIRPMITFGGTSSNGSGLTSQSSNWSSSTAALKVSGNSWGTIAGVGFVFYP